MLWKRVKLALCATVLMACWFGTGASASAAPASTAAVTAATACDPSAFPPGHAFPFGTWPSACWRPYDDLSAFNVPVPAAVPAPSAADCRTVTPAAGCPEAGATLPPPGNLQFDPNGWVGWPTYYVAGTDDAPSYRVRCTGANGNGACDPPSDTPGNRVPIPVGKNLAIQAGPARQDSPSGPPICVQPDPRGEPRGDCHVTVVDTRTGIEHDLFATHTRDGFLRPLTVEGEQEQVVVAGGSGHLAIAGDGRAAGPGGGVAAGTGNLAGRIRLEEFQAAVDYERGQGGRPIGHALAITVPCIAAQAGAGASRYPATRPNKGGHKCASGPAPLMGTRFRLRPTAEQFAALPDWQRAIVRAASTYGLVAMDIAGGVALQFESGNQYTSALGTTVSPWYEYARQVLGFDAPTISCSSWTGLGVPGDTADTSNCPAVGRLNTAAFQAAWATAKVAPECASYPGSSASSCQEIRTTPGLALSTSAPAAGSSVAVTGSNYPPGARVVLCQAPLGASRSCPAGAPTTTSEVGWDGTWSATLTVAATAGNSDCTQPDRCMIFVPDAIWDRPTGRPEAHIAVTVTTPPITTPPTFTRSSPPLKASVGVRYAYTFAASGNPAPTFALSGAPAWLHIDARTGEVTGTPPAAAAGTSTTYTVTASNGLGAVSAGPFRILIEGSPRPRFTHASPPIRAWARIRYRYRFRATGTPAPTFALHGAPRWLRIDRRSGTVSGRPPTRLIGRRFRYAVTAQNAAGSASTRQFVIRVGAPADAAVGLRVQRIAGRSIRYAVSVTNRSRAAVEAATVACRRPAGTTVIRPHGSLKHARTIRWHVARLGPRARRAWTLTLAAKRGVRAVRVSCRVTSANDPHQHNNAVAVAVRL